LDEVISAKLSKTLKHRGLQGRDMEIKDIKMHILGGEMLGYVTSFSTVPEVRGRRPTLHARALVGLSRMDLLVDTEEYADS